MFWHWITTTVRYAIKQNILTNIYIYIYTCEPYTKPHLHIHRVDTAVLMHHLDANKMAEEEARRQLHKNVASNIELVLAPTPHKAQTIRPPASHHENYPS